MKKSVLCFTTYSFCASWKCEDFSGESVNQLHCRYHVCKKMHLLLIDLGCKWNMDEKVMRRYECPDLSGKKIVRPSSMTMLRIIELFVRSIDTICVKIMSHRDFTHETSPGRKHSMFIFSWYWTSHVPGWQTKFVVHDAKLVSKVGSLDSNKTRSIS